MHPVLPDDCEDLKIEKLWNLRSAVNEPDAPVGDLGTESASWFVSVGVDEEIGEPHGYENRVAAFDAAAAQQSGDLMALRHKKGRPGDLRDTIFGIVMASYATLATRNVSHFQDFLHPGNEPVGQLTENRPQGVALNFTEDKLVSESNLGERQRANQRSGVRRQQQGHGTTLFRYFCNLMA